MEKSIESNLINVNVYRKEGSSIEHYDIDFLIQLLGSVSKNKGFDFNIQNLVRISQMINECSDSNQKNILCSTLANELMYRFGLFVKYLEENSISDFDWFSSCKDNSSLVIYGINNVISELRKSIISYCERINGNSLKDYFLDQLKIVRSSSDGKKRVLA